MTLSASLALLTLPVLLSVPMAEGPVAVRELRTQVHAGSTAADASPTASDAGMAKAPDGADESPAEPAEDEPGVPAENGQVADALEAGDLTTALERARTQREANPSSASWAQEAQVLEAKGEWVAAIAAYREAANRADEAERTRYEDRIAALDDSARGVVNDEPGSSHREALDGARRERELAANPPPPPPPVEAPKPAPPPDRIIKKWYFWVTIGAVVASAGAVTGIAIKSASDERKRSGSVSMGSAGPTLIRF